MATVTNVHNATKLLLERADGMIKHVLDCLGKDAPAFEEVKCSALVQQMIGVSHKCMKWASDISKKVDPTPRESALMDASQKAVVVLQDKLFLLSLYLFLAGLSTSLYIPKP